MHAPAAAACTCAVGGVATAILPLLLNPDAQQLLADCADFATTELPVCAETNDLFLKAGCCAKACADALNKVRALPLSFLPHPLERPCLLAR